MPVDGSVQPGGAHAKLEGHERVVVAVRAGRFLFPRTSRLQRLLKIPFYPLTRLHVARW